MPHTQSFSDTLILVTNDGLGNAEPDLGRKLFVKYLEVLEANGSLPGVIAFYTRGVHLACEGSPAIEKLRAFEAAGVRIVLCKTCLDYYGLADKVQVGVVGGMGDIVAAQAMAHRVITV
ncbi:MAG: DsrE family protein [Planctomycetes bacterium]|nr:DsrE family protein [Planctomycetota bacterium]